MVFLKATIAQKPCQGENNENKVHLIREFNNIEH